MKRLHRSDPAHTHPGRSRNSAVAGNLASGRRSRRRQQPRRRRPRQPAPRPRTPQASIPFDQLLRPSRNPFDAYRGKTVPPPSLANSMRLGSLVRDGKLYLSLRDAIDLALENNLDLVIARYNLPIAQMDILRTQAGGSGARRQYRRRVGHARRRQARPAAAVPAQAAQRSGAGGAGAGSSGIVSVHAGNRHRGLQLRSHLSAHRSIATTHRNCCPTCQLGGRPIIQGQHHRRQRELLARPSPTGGSLQVRLGSTTGQTSNSPYNTFNPQLYSKRSSPVRSSSCWPASAWGQTCAFCASPRPTRRSPTSPSKPRSLPL